MSCRKLAAPPANLSTCQLSHQQHGFRIDRAASCCREASMAGLSFNPSDIIRLPVTSDEQKFEDWSIKYQQSHILNSQCVSADSCANNSANMCQFCTYKSALKLPHLPDMVFPQNMLVLTHDSGLEINFNALDALRRVSSDTFDVKVAHAQIWQNTRSEKNLEEKVVPFDWTFTTDYKGTVANSLNVEETRERIDMEKLKQREKILFYQELVLFEDELHDNGVASSIVKIRVMPSSFFVLLRFFLRVDNVLVRINDTRLYHEFKTDYLLREYTNRESEVKALNLPLGFYSDANAIMPHLPLKLGSYEKITWPNSS